MSPAVHRKNTRKRVGSLIVAAALLASGVGAADQDFEFVEGTAEVTGDPGLGRKAGQANWKDACARWRDDMERRNRGHQIVSLECNSPAYTIEQGHYVFKSTANYRIRMRTRADDERRDAAATPAPTPTPTPTPTGSP